MVESLQALFDDLNALHLDLKPANFLLHFPLCEEEFAHYKSAEELFSQEFKVVLCDFGIAKVLEDEKLNDTAVGTRRYWAPERWENQEHGI